MRHLLAISAASAVERSHPPSPPIRSGSYSVEGTNPGLAAPNIRGTGTVEKTGDTYRVIWVVGSTRYVGTGIGDHDFLAVSYKSGSDTGLALYGADGGNWAGVWAYSGGRQMGTEIWKRE